MLVNSNVINNQDNWKEKSAQGHKTENVFRLAQQVNGVNCEMVGEIDRYYHFGDIILDGENMVEIKQDNKIHESNNILFERYHKYPMANIRITQKNKYNLQYRISDGWFQTGEYSSLVFVDTVEKMFYVIEDYQAAKQFILNNLGNDQIVKPKDGLIDYKENALGYFYLVPVAKLVEAGLLEIKPIEEPVKGFVEDHYDSWNESLMKQVEFIPIIEN
ncbi:hypothetical protein [Aminipila terrae]|uniref:Uncharacterized protein n=1 Tax=Aminipila terrae TaxID=2697030 RepID=A0A6P1MJ72_9FIRM|nr:hypothetical protein [Aminipila terrae]QHI72674.1 hypothetical protein Ami3637_09930 [Aminipila terrae]